MNELNRITVSVSGCTGIADNTLYPAEETVCTAKALETVCKRDHIAGSYRNHYRSDANFLWADCIFMDCDNDGTNNHDAWLTPDIVADRLPSVAFYAVTSRHHETPKHEGESNEHSARPRHHYYFPLRSPISDSKIISHLKEKILKLCPEMDSGAKSVSQLFFGHDNPSAVYYPGDIDIREYVQKQPTAECTEKEKAVNPFRNTPGTARVDNTVDFINATLGLILDAIPADGEKMWSEVAVCLCKMGNGSDDFFDAFDRYSAKSSKYKGSDDCRKKWNAKKRQLSNSPHLDFYYLVSLAEQYDNNIKGKLSDIGKQLNHTINTETGEVKDASRKYSLADAITDYGDVEIKETEYLYFPWFPRGKLTAIQGDSSSGKSTFIYAIGASVTTGSPLLGIECENPGNVIFITSEDDESDILTSFQDSGGDPAKLKRLTRQAISELDLSVDGAKSINDIIERYDIKLLVLDPIQAFLCGDMNKANETRPQLARLMDIAEKHGTTIVFIEHMGKDTSRGAIHRGLGSTDIGAATRSLLQVVCDPEDDNSKIVFTVKNNTASKRDVSKAIKYQIADHPGSYDHHKRKRHHFHGHAVFTEIIPDYGEKAYKKALKRSEEAEERAVQMSIDYESDPLVITSRKLIAQNPGGLFISGDDLVRKITECCGHCPYECSKSKTNGIYNRISTVRNAMKEKDSIQMDLQSNAIFTKPYNWNGAVFQPDRVRTRGVYLAPIKNGSDSGQQTEL